MGLKNSALILAAIFSVGVLTADTASAQVATDSPYAITVESNVSGEFDAILWFTQLDTDNVLFLTTASGTFDLLAEDGSTGQGLYSEIGLVLGGNFAVTFVTATGGDDDQYVGEFTATYTNIFGIPFLSGISGEGMGNAGDMFTFSD